MKPYNEMTLDERAEYLYNCRNQFCLQLKEDKQKEGDSELDPEIYKSKFLYWEKKRRELTHSKLDEQFAELKPYFYDCDESRFSSKNTKTAIQHANDFESSMNFFDENIVCAAQSVLTELGFHGLSEKLELVGQRLYLSKAEQLGRKLVGDKTASKSPYFFIKEIAKDVAKKYSVKYPDRLSKTECTKQALEDIYNRIVRELADSKYKEEPLFDNNEGLPDNTNRTMRNNIKTALKELSLQYSHRKKPKSQ